MSHCWPRSHSPVGSNVVFFKPRALPRQAFLLLGGFHISFYFPVLYIITSTIHIDPVMLTHTTQSLIEVDGSVVKASLNVDPILHPHRLAIV